MLGWLKRRRLYRRWIHDIVTFQVMRDGGREHAAFRLLEHMHHHIAEGESEGVSYEWFASMDNLMEIARAMHGQPGPSPITVRLERMMLHWTKDPDNTTPPPGSDARMNAAVERVMRDAEERLGRPRPTPRGGDWHGSWSGS